MLVLITTWLTANSMAHPTEPDPRLNFQAFFNGWLIRQENFSYQLLNAITQENVDKNDQHQRLIEQVLSHYQQYFEEKSLAAREDAFLFFSPPWFTSFEKTFLWIGGFRPSLIFRLINNSVHDLKAKQEREIDRVKAETRKEERELAETTAGVQESLASPPLMNLARRTANLVDGEVPELESAMKELRGTVVRKVLLVLYPIQTIKLLAAAAQFQLRVRRLGLQQDERRTAAAGL